MRKKYFNNVIISLLAISSTLFCACDFNDVAEGLGINVSTEVSEDNNQTLPIEITVVGVESNDNNSGQAPTITIVDDSSPVILEGETDNIEEVETPVIEEDIYDPVGKVYSIKAASVDETTLSFVGDVGFAEGYATINKCRSMANGIYDCIYPEVMDIMTKSDIMMANNEFPYSYRGSPTPNKTYTFRADPKDVELMGKMGVDIVSLANNHAYDYGPDALIDTIDTLNDAHLPFVGAGKNIEEARKPVYFHVNGHVISYVSATQIERYGNPDTREATEDSPGVLRTLNAGSFVPTIEEAEANSDFVVVYVHWGSESTDLVEQNQRDLARAYVDAGADLIIGDHSHCLQGIDYVSGVPVFYSLGNFWFNSKTLDTCIVTATLDRDCKIEKIEFIPCLQTACTVRIGDGDNYDRILEYMRGISNHAQIDENGYVTYSETDHNIQNGQNTSPAKKAPTPEPVAEPVIDPAALLPDMTALPETNVEIPNLPEEPVE